MSTKTTNRLTKILAMLPWVIANRGATVSEVCDRFGYTRKELLADLDLVFVCGLPGYGPGDLMVAYVEDEEVVVDTADYFGAAPRLNPAETLALLAAGMTMVGSGQASSSLVSAVDKLSRSLLPPDEEVLTVDMYVDATLAPTLRKAAAESRVCRIEYRALSTDEMTSRQVEPWTVFSSLGNTYLAAHCRRAGAERVFRVDRIKELEVLDEQFEPPPRIPEPQVRYTPGENDAVAVIDLSPEAAWVIDYYPIEVLRRDLSNVRVRFSAFDPMVAARLLLRLGSSGSLVEGDQVRAALERLRGQILERYGTPVEPSSG
jgi:proteasome accessory factor C